MAATRPLLVLDLGTTTVKAALVSEDGTVRDHVQQEGAPLQAGEADAEGWWSACVAVVRSLLARNAEAGPVLGVVCTGQWSGTVSLDAAGRVLGPALTWMDARGAAATARAMGGPLAIEGYAPTKLWAFLRRTGGLPSLSGKDTLGHLLYLRDERPSLFREAGTFLEPVDFLAFRLCGRAATSAATATLTWLTDTRVLGRVAYDPWLSRLAGIGPEKLPELVPVDAVLGPVLPAVAAQLGLAEGTPVLVSVPDVLAAAVGSGAIGEGAAHVNFGTSTTLGVHLRKRTTDLGRRLAALPSALPDRYLLVTSQENAGICLTWLAGLLFPGARDGVESLLGLAGEAVAGSGGVLFAPWLNGERAPVDNPALRGAFVNLGLRTTRGELARAVVEGIAMNTRWLLEHVEGATGPLRTLRVGGGVAASDLWCQVLADVSGRPVERVGAAGLMTARGAALVMLAALGRVSTGALAGLSPVERRFEPDTTARALHDRRFKAFRQLGRGGPAGGASAQ